MSPRVEHCGRNQPDHDDGDGRQRGALPFADRSHVEDAHGERVPTERPRDQRDRHFLHDIDEDQNRGGEQAGAQQRYMHLAHRCAPADAQTDGSFVEAVRHALQTAFDWIETDGKKSRHVGEQHRQQRALQQQ